jgi:hypothetical protein
MTTLPPLWLFVAGAQAMPATARVARAAGCAALLACVTLACVPPATPPPPPDEEPPPFSMPARELCGRGYAGTPTSRGRLQDPRLTEISGVVPSVLSADLFWVHNDSGDDAVLYALRADGSLRGVVALPFAVRDLEDIAIAACPDGSGPCLWLADTGNNAGTRDDTAVWAFPEPPLPDGGVFPDDARVAGAWRIDVSWQAGMPVGIDSEALVVLPDASALLLFEKIDAPEARVFVVRAPFATSAVGDAPALEVPRRDGPPEASVQVLGTVTTASPAVRLGRMITAADLHPGGGALVVRTYTGIFAATFAAGQTALDLPDVPLATVTFGPFNEPQGEAISYDETGLGLVTITEARDIAVGDVAVNHFPCQ